MLKEIDIVAFGKRVKIANAINELKRTTSVMQDNQANTSGYSGMPGYNPAYAQSSSFAAGPLSSGMMQHYLTQQPYSASPTMQHSPIGLGYSSTYAGGPMHTRNQSMSSNAASALGEAYTDANSSIGQEAFGVRNQLQSAPANQLTYVPEEMGRAATVPIDRNRSESDPGLLATSATVVGGVLGAAAAGAAALAHSATTGATNAVSNAADATASVLRTGSLVCLRSSASSKFDADVAHFTEEPTAHGYPFAICGRLIPWTASSRRRRSFSEHSRLWKWTCVGGY